MCISLKSKLLNIRLVIVFLMTLFSSSFLSLSANATEIWSINEWRIHLPKESNQWGEYLPQKMKVQTENQFSEWGYQQFLLRTGPVWKINSWLDAAAYVSAVHKQGTESLYKEIRWEFEPTFKGTIGSLQWSNRNRLAYRVFLDDTRWRYRNRTKLVYPLIPSEWALFASDELFFTREGFAQNRWLLGFSQHKGNTWSLAWQNRVLKTNEDWRIENGLVFSLTM